ncbi:MAG: hypothetical protein KatS3mg104_2285 [Phycisphaerae bacterium]|jgi:polyhydroxybutyrate depolymerase|nr:MAG: hypothetical protein KatS3mg104_2285 [Phycisphaerae bacterium]
MRIVLFLIAILGLWGVVSAQTNVSGHLIHDGVSRSYITHLPPSWSADQSVPLVVALHPSFSSGASFQSSSGWDQKSDQEGFIVVYPTGGKSVGSGTSYAWNSYDFSGSAPDDLGFLVSLINQLSSDYNVDTNRVYMTGFSNGAMMTNTFASAHADKVTAIAPVSGGWITAYGGDESDLQPNRPVPVWIWRGENEDFTTGSPGSAMPRDQQDQAQLAFWKNHNQATLSTTVQEYLSYGILPRLYTTQIHVGNAPVWFTEVSGTAHQYQPGAADLIWDRFFSQIVPEPAGVLWGWAGLSLLCSFALRRRFS